MEHQYETRAERSAKKRLERHQGQPKTMPGRWMWLGVLVLLGAGIWWWAQADKAPTDPAAVTKAHQHLVDSCTTDMATTFHIHAHLTISINGVAQTIPADAGISATCMHALHTHDDIGIIHIEAPKKDDLTLADFFHIWGKDYIATKIFDQTVTADSQLKLFVDGQETASGPATVLHDHVSYAIVFGPAKTKLVPPANYQFPTSL